MIIEGVATRVSSPVLIGRSVEFERLRAALRHARDGRSSTIVVAGEAGVGKTRLISEFADFADRDGAVVLSGGCIVLGDGSLPYAPVVEALRGLVRRLSPEELEAIVGNGRSDLARLVPDLGPAEDDGAAGLDSSWAQGRLFEMLLGVLDRLAAMAPVVFIVEDLHWSDRSTRDLVGFLIRNLRDVRVALVLTYRTDDLHRRHPLVPFLAELDRSGRVERLEVGPFDRSESAQQLRAIAGHDLDSTSSSRSTPARAATPSSPRSCSSHRPPSVTASCRRRFATCCWRASPSWPSRPRSSFGWRPRPVSGSIPPCSPPPLRSTRRRSTTRCANA